MIFNATNTEIARRLLEMFISQFEQKAPKAVDTLERGFEDAIAVLTLPKYYRRRLRTTNGAERLNEEIRRRERVIRIFPNCESVIRLVGAVLLEKNEEFLDRRYFERTEYWTWREERKKLAQAAQPELPEVNLQHVLNLTIQSGVPAVSVSLIGGSFKIWTEYRTRQAAWQVRKGTTW